MMRGQDKEEGRDEGRSAVIRRVGDRLDLMEHREEGAQGYGSTEKRKDRLDEWM